MKSSIKKKLLKTVFSVVFIYTSISFSTSDNSASPQECFMVLVGKAASSSGSVLLAHNNDLTGKEASFLEIIPGTDETGFTSISYSDELSISLPAKTYRVLMQRIEKGFKEGDAVAVNEFGVAIAGGVALGSDRNSKAKQFAPLVSKGLPGGIRYDILARSRTARECVEMLGDAYFKYGVSYPSGVGIADTNEIWYIECGGGREWAAVRIPDSCYWVQANGYRIGEIDTLNKQFFLTSPGLLEFCITNNLWDPQSGPFNFAKVFGSGRTEEDGGLKYDRLRIWRGIDFLTPSLNVKTSDDNLPLFVKPDMPVSELHLFKLMRDFYGETPFDKSLEESADQNTRSIATRGGVHSSLIVISPKAQTGTGAVIWSGIGSSLITGFIPIPFGVSSLPPEYSHGQSGSAFDNFYRLSGAVSGDWNKIKEIQNAFKKNERNLLIKFKQLMHSEYSEGINSESLSSFTRDAAKITLEHVKQWLDN